MHDSECEVLLQVNFIWTLIITLPLVPQSFLSLQVNGS